MFIISLFSFVCVPLLTSFFTGNQAIKVNSAKKIEQKLSDFNNLIDLSNKRSFIMGCDSDSMGVLLRCGDRVEARELFDKEYLSLGDIYIYEYFDEFTNETIRVVHRLVGCVDDDCQLTIFKGDNNRIAELIPRVQVKWKLSIIEY